MSFFQRASGVTDLAQVRYLTAQRSGTGADEHFTHWIATIQYAYAQPSRDPKVRRWNPLGFRVIEFTAEPETLAPSLRYSPADGVSGGRIHEQRHVGTVHQQFVRIAELGVCALLAGRDNAASGFCE